MKILITDKVSPQAIEILKNEKGIFFEERFGLTRDELRNIIEPFSALIIRSSVTVTQEILDKAKNLKVIGRAGVGVDNVDLEAATQKGIYVLNTPFGNVNSAAEHTIAMILSLSRHIHEAHHSLKRERKWDRKCFVGVEVKGKTLGVVGFGKVGKIVTEIASKGLKMKVLVFDPFVGAKKIRELGGGKTDLDTLLEQSDYVTVHTPLTSETGNLIDEKEIKKMKNGVKIINVARGGIINEKALYKALKKGKVGGAAIDVWEKEPAVDNELLELPNVLATPHLGASTIEALENVTVDIACEIIDALKKGCYRNVVNKELLEK